MEIAAPHLIGRDDALAAVAAAIRADRPVVVVGEAGIGKTALVRAAVAAAGRPLHEGGGFATLAWLPYLALRRATGLADTSAPDHVAALVEHAVGPDVLFIDDLQWTDPETRAVVGLLLGRVALVAAIRDGDPDTEAALDPLRERGVEVVRLLGLDQASATSLVGHVRPDLTPALARQIVGLAGGNPLLLEELAAHGQSSTSLARAIVGQLDLLAPRDRAALELVALAARPLPVGALGPAATDLIDRGLLRSTPDGLEVRHGLIADAIVAQIDDAARATLHGRLAELLDDPAERARHLASAGRRDEAAATALAALEAAADPRSRAVLLTIAAEASDDDGADALRVRAAEELGALGDDAAAAELLQRRPVAGPDEQRALAAATLVAALGNLSRHAEALAVVEGARALRPDPSGRAAIQLAVNEATTLVNVGRLRDAIGVVERARAAAGPAASDYRLTGHHAALRLYAGDDDRLDALEAAFAAAIEAGDGGRAVGRAMDLYYMNLALRGGPAAYAFAMTAADQEEALGYSTRASELRAEAMQASIFAGALAGTVLEVDLMLESPVGPVSRHRLQYNRGLALGLLGHFEDADRTLAEVARDATNDFDGRGSALWCWSEASFWSGQPRRALEQAEAALELTAFNDAEFVLPSLARAWAEVELGRRPTPVPVDAPFRCLAGAAPEVRGLDALARGEDRAAAEAFDEAAGLWLGMHVPRELLCRWAAGEALRRAGEREVAVARLRETLAAATAIGFEPLAGRVRRSLRLAGERATSTPPTGPRGGLLTLRERQILGLVERGLTNAEIARRMSLGRPTVARLLSNAMLKLGAESRAQAVVLAAAEA